MEEKYVNMIFIETITTQILQNLAKTFCDMKDIGHLSVKVIKAQGLRSSDLVGKGDPFAVLEMGNDRVQTHTEPNTVEPVWKTMFTL